MITKGTKNFAVSEFACNCGCGLMNVRAEVADGLQYIRGKLKKPLSIRSGSRCPKHNRKYSSNETSDHVIGYGVDVVASNSRDRFLILKYAFEYGFDRIAYKGDFIHLGMTLGFSPNPAMVTWNY